LFAGLGACATTVGADFYTKYAKACQLRAEPVPRDSLTQGAVAEAARAHLVSEVGARSEALRRCYEEALANVPRTQGRVVLRLSVTPQGKLEGLGVVENATGIDAMACCVASVVQPIDWPPSAAGSSVTMEYPFTFRLVRMPVGYRYDVGPEFAHTKVRPEGYEVDLDGALYGGAP